MKNLYKIFGTTTPIIGAVHLSPLLGYDNFDGINKVLQRAIFDVEVFEQGGVSGIIIENNYDLPHQIEVGPETIAAMTLVISEISKRTKLPLGVSVLWNDYKAALAIAKVTSAKFIRVPVFVDKVKTSFGEIIGNPKEVIAYRKKIGADDVALFTDIQVKHAELLEEKPISVSAEQAFKAGADAVIVTGRWTGEAPSLAKLQEVRKTIEHFPILVGSGASSENIQELLQFADGAIVSTLLKTGTQKPSQEERNIKSYQERVDEKKVKEFMQNVEAKRLP